MKIDSNKYEVRIRYSPLPGDECFIAEVIDMPGVMAHGDTREAAAREIQAALKLALDTYKTSKEAPPPPVNHAAKSLGAQGGSTRSPAKARAAKLNGVRGGRPRKTQATA